MSKDTRKFWATRGFNSVMSKGGWLDLETWAEQPSEYVEIKKHYDSDERMPEKFWPTGLFVKYSKRQETVIKALKDLSVTQLGIMIVSKRFYDLLQDFNLGRTAFKAMPTYGYDRKTRFPEDYYMMQIVEHHGFSQLEHMEHVDMYASGNYCNWYPDKSSHKAVLSIPEHHDLDLWIDSRISSWVFVSDRLRQAIKTEEIKGTQFGFRACKLING